MPNIAIANEFVRKQINKSFGVHFYQGPKDFFDDDIFCPKFLK